MTHILKKPRGENKQAKKEKLPTINCQPIIPTTEIIKPLLKEHGICILENYYPDESIDELIDECKRLFAQQKDNIEILDAEDCSNDERIFHAQKYSNLIRDKFANEPLFDSLARCYNPNLNKKTLINRLTHEEGMVKNSGAGWHRDNHHCQFKSIMYLSDVTEHNGNFQWVTNSSQSFIGLPTPREPGGRTTRFHDHVVQEIIASNPRCALHNIIGKKGTIILADTTYIHRGRIIDKGERLALTQYYFT